MLKKCKEKVFRANLQLVENKLVLYTGGNVSERDRESGLVVIKPSGASYAEMTADVMVVMDLDGNVVEGQLRPSSDTPTHLEIYKAYPEICGVTHTHSTFATSWAQAGRDIPFYGTTHADYFYGDIPCARALTREEVEGEYEKTTGLVILERFRKDGLKPMEVPGVLVKSHGVFAFGKDAAESVHNATVMEEIAKMAFLTESVNPEVSRADLAMMYKHFLRKHGANAYYGQAKK